MNKIVTNPSAGHKQGRFTAGKGLKTLANLLLFASPTGQTT
jgi:hypothetical protein